MGEATARIPKGKFAFIELKETYNTADEKNLVLDNLEEEIKKRLVGDDDSGKNLEVILIGKKCPKCGSEMSQHIGMSSKNNKPYHLVKCVNNFMLPKGVKPDKDGNVAINGETKKYCEFSNFIKVKAKEKK